MASQYRKLPVEDSGAPGSVDSFNGRTGIVVSQSGDYTASQITNVPHGTVSSTDVQGAINELADEKGSGTVTNVATGTGLTGGPITTTGTISLANTAVTPGSYTYSSITVDQQGRLTAASSGVAPTAAITALTGDVTATGPGSVPATIAVGAVTDTKASLSVKPAVTVVAVSNLTLSGAQTIDGQLTVAGTSIVLATAQSAPAENGPWVVQAGAWTRPTWFPSGGTTQAIQFSTYFVRLGVAYQGSTWRQTTAMPATIDTTALAFVITPLVINSSTVIYITPFTTKTANYNIAVTDSIIFCNTSGGAFSLTLPDPATVTTQPFRIIDKNGTFGTNNLTLNRHNSEQIIGLVANKILQTNWGAYSVWTDGVNWWLS